MVLHKEQPEPEDEKASEKEQYQKLEYNIMVKSPKFRNDELEVQESKSEINNNKGNDKITVQKINIDCAQANEYSATPLNLANFTWDQEAQQLTV